MFSDREQNVFYSRIERFLAANRKLLHGSFYENEWIVTVILYYCFPSSCMQKRENPKPARGQNVIE